MNTVLFNKSLVAIPSVIPNDAVTVPVTPFETFATEYGLFIPTSMSGYSIVRWIRKGFPELPEQFDVLCDILHISNSGEVMIVTADRLKNNITQLPYMSDDIAYLSLAPDTNEAYSYLFRKYKHNMAEAIKFLEDESLKGFYNPIVFTVEDWVKYAAEKKYTKDFFRFNFVTKK